MAAYNPPTKVVTTEIPYLSMVTQADPNFTKDKYRAPEYTFTRRVFTANPYERGIYNWRSNIYPVGQPYGGLDEDVVDNKPLFAGVPTGSWA